MELDHDTTSDGGCRSRPSRHSVWRRIRDDERGAGYLAAFLVLFSVLGLAGVGILVDSARMFATHRQCDSIAMEAARAGANALDAVAIGNGQVQVASPAAEAAAADAVASFVSGAGVSLQSVSVTGNRVTVTVAATTDPWFPLIRSRTLTGTATASATRTGQAP